MRRSEYIDENKTRSLHDDESGLSIWPILMESVDFVRSDLIETKFDFWPEEYAACCNTRISSYGNKSKSLLSFAFADNLKCSKKVPIA